MNCRSVRGKWSVGVCISKQITKTIRNYYKAFSYWKLEEKEQNKSRSTVYVVETTDEEAKRIKLHHLSRYFLIWQLFLTQIIGNV